MAFGLNNIICFITLLQKSENGTEALYSLLEVVKEVASKEHAKERLPPFFNPTDFLPSDRSSFYRYPGSLTTPPCSEIVTWTILKSKLPISSDQVRQLLQ